MTKEELLLKLKECSIWDEEAAHGEADDLLLKYINDKDITEAFEDVPKWYS